MDLYSNTHPAEILKESNYLTNKIIIPQGVDCYGFRSRVDGQISYHIYFKEDKKAFEKFVKENNLKSVEGITVSINHVFTNNKDLFFNFPQKFDIL